MKKPYIICHMMTSIDGRSMEHPLTHLHLTDVKRFDSDAVWLRYSV